MEEKPLKSSVNLLYDSFFLWLSHQNIAEYAEIKNLSETREAICLFFCFYEHVRGVVITVNIVQFPQIVHARLEIIVIRVPV